MLEKYYRALRLNTMEILVFKLALESTAYNEFAIEHIRWDAFFKYDRPLSYKQVRNAIFRMRAKGLPIRHICRGSYRWSELS